MFRHIYVPFDNSEHSQWALELGIELARLGESTLVGSHVYAAKLHDWRFRALESGLPEAYRQERELERQRVVHDSLITSGLELITDSYLRVMRQRCESAGVPFRGVSLEGRNWQALTSDIAAEDYDLVVMGALGLGRTVQSLVGTVCERVVRRARRDVLVVRRTEPLPADAPIVVCLDGSRQAWGGFELAMLLARHCARPLVAVAAFDPYFHYTLFDALKSALTAEARELFKFEQQERLHEEIIDSGLAKIYRSHLDIAAGLAGEAGVALESRLLDGKPAEKLLQCARELRPWLMVLGRTGVHGGGELDLGGVAEQLLRLAPCNLLLAARELQPPAERIAESTTAWSDEARARLDKAPPQVRGIAMAAIQRYAVAEGHTMITSSVVDAALAQILPPAAQVAMGIGSSTPRRTEPLTPSLQLAYACPACPYVHKGQRPSRCPVCGARGSGFQVVSGAKPSAEGAGRTVTAFDGVALSWREEAWRLLEAIPDYFLRKRAQHRIEKTARSKGLREVDLELARPLLAESLPSRPAPDAAAEGAAMADHSARPGALRWTSEALERLGRAPEGYMREQAQASIEAHASATGTSTITLELAEAGMARARERMLEALEGPKR